LFSFRKILNKRETGAGMTVGVEWSTNLRNRLVVGFTGGLFLLIVAYLGGWFFFGFILALTMVALYELQSMGAKAGVSRFNPLLYLFGIIILFDFYIYSAAHLYIIIIFFVTSEIILSFILNKENQLIECAYTIFTSFYAVLFTGSLVLIREAGRNGQYTIGYKVIWSIFFGIWFLDTTAYFVGKSIGRQKLCPQISPNKTIEGSIGGFIAAIAALIIGKYAFFKELSIIHSVNIGIILGVMGQIGDVAESFIKRKAGVKDSSAILPGHGGILDRFDSLIFASPFVYLYLTYIVRL